MKIIFSKISNRNLYSRLKINGTFNFIIGILIFLLNLPYSKAQDISTLSKPDSITLINCYFAPSISLLETTYRDFATSPLFYSGYGLNFGLSWIKEMKQWENAFEMNLAFSYVKANAPKSNYFKTTVNAYFINAQCYDHYLRKIDKFSNDKYDVKLGGALATSLNSRINTSLQNNSLGIEALLNFMISAKATRDVSRKQEKVQNWLIFKRTVYPVKRSLSFQLNAGLLNMNYRPGYAYIENGVLNGMSTNVFSYFLTGYKWTVNGWRLGTRIEFTGFRPNGNGHKWSYLWDAASLPGRFEPFQMASHRIQYTLMFNYTKRKKI